MFAGTFDVTITEEMAERIADLASAEGSVTLQVKPPWTERLFEAGDLVTIYSDAGRPLPARVTGASPGFVRVSYQDDRYSTSLPESAVVTDHVVHHPAEVTLR